MDFVRTPDERFANIPDWPYAPVYTDVKANDGTDTELRVAHYEAGAADAKETVIMMHGEPTWSFLYRKMMKTFLAAGHRVIAPDLVGFGRSDKPTLKTDYTYERHVDWMNQWLNINNFSGLTMMCQDWGGLIGLRLVTANVDRFDRVVVSNTGLPMYGKEPSKAFRAWQKFSQEVPVFDVGKLCQGGALSTLSDAEIAAYDAPFPDETFKSAARIFPTLYPDGENDPSNIANKKAWEILEGFTKPFLCAFSDGDPISAGGERAFIGKVPGTANQPHTTIVGGGHFVQEDKGEELAGVINDFMAATPK